MPRFSNKFKKPFFWPILGPFSQFWGQKKICHENPAAMHNFKWDYSTMLKFRKNWSHNSKKMAGETEGWKDKRTGRRTEGQTDPILQNPSSYCQGSNNYRNITDTHQNISQTFEEKSIIFHDISLPKLGKNKSKAMENMTESLNKISKLCTNIVKSLVLD